MASSDSERLIGTWQLEHADEQLQMNEPVEMEFRPTGELIYAIELKDRWQIMRLTYEIRGNRLVTNQPSSPREEETEFEVDGRGALILNYGGAKGTFVRGPKRAPDV